MSKIKGIADLIEEARAIQGRVTGDYRHYQDNLVLTRHKIKRTFSGSTQAAMTDLYEQKARQDLFKTIRNETTAYQDALKKAKSASEQIIHAAAPRPAQETIDRFERSLSDLKTELMLATNSETGKRLLIDFVGSVSDPFLANRVREEYVALVSPIVVAAGSQAPRFKNDLSIAFQQLRDATLSQEGKEAVRLLETVESLRASSVYPQIVKDRIAEHFGRAAASLVDDPETYFQEFSGDADLPLAQLNMLTLTLEQQ